MKLNEISQAYTYHYNKICYVLLSIMFLNIYETNINTHINVHNTQLLHLKSSSRYLTEIIIFNYLL